MSTWSSQSLTPAAGATAPPLPTSESGIAIALAGKLVGAWLARAPPSARTCIVARSAYLARDMAVHKTEPPSRPISPRIVGMARKEPLPGPPAHRSGASGRAPATAAPEAVCGSNFADGERDNQGARKEHPTREEHCPDPTSHHKPKQMCTTSPTRRQRCGAACADGSGCGGAWRPFRNADPRGVPEPTRVPRDDCLRGAPEGGVGGPAPSPRSRRMLLRPEAGGGGGEARAEPASAQEVSGAACRVRYAPTLG